MNQQVLVLALGMTLQGTQLLSCAGDLPAGDCSKTTSGGALEEIDLASGTAWTLSADGGTARPIKVPYGGWNSDWQEPRIDTMTGINVYALYERKVIVPKVTDDQVTRISFGAVNYGADVFVNDKLMGSHVGSMTPFEVDVTEAVEPGKEYTLKVKAYHRRRYMVPVPVKPVELSPFQTNKVVKKAPTNLLTCSVPVSIDTPVGSANWVGCGWFGKDKFAYGIIRHIKMKVLPPIHVDEVFVKPSVSNDTLTVVVSVRNSLASEKSLVLSGQLSPWNSGSWQYPAIPDVKVVIPAGQSKEIVIGPMKWGLGTKSYWWPNIPFREDYTATLHNLVLDIKEPGWLLSKKQQTYTQRFGFCEHSEGPYYYRVNGVRVFQVGDVTTESQIGNYDSYATVPAFLPPTGPKTGCPETWRRYMRCGINANRVSCNIPTKYMLEAADEVGFMLIPEAVTFGNNIDIYGPVHDQTAKEMAMLCRNHPSVMRYSLGNEIRGSMEPWRPLIDAILEVDDTRPLIFDRQGGAGGKFAGIKRGHAYDSSHYGKITKTPRTSIYNMGEWGTGSDFMAEFAIAAAWMRLYDWAYVAPWCWLNYWPNFFDGIDRSRHVQDIYNGVDRQDGVNGWGSPVLDLVQRAMHPYLLLDIGIMEEKENLPPVVDWQGFKGKTPWHEVGQGDVQWPRNFPSCVAGETVARQIAVFNGGLEGDKLSLRWSGRWDNATGTVAVAGATVGPLEIQPGFHTNHVISFTAPALDRDTRRLYVVLESLKAGSVVYREDRIYLTVSTPASCAPGVSVPAVEKL